MTKWVSGGIVALLVVLSIWFTSPYLALRGVQEAIANNSADALSEHIEYDSLRANVKVRVGGYLKESVAPNVPKMLQDRILSQSSGVVDKAVDSYVTPEMLKRLMENKPVQDSADKAENDIKRTWDVRWWTERKSLNEVWLHIASTNPRHEGREVIVHFKRISGITWKAVDVDPASWKDWALQRLKASSQFQR